MPDISVVVPLYNAHSYLPMLLEHLEKQTFELSRFEVILVDDCSPLNELSQKVLQDLNSPLAIETIWRKTNGGVSAARNMGWQAARAPLVLFIDQDCLAHPKLLESHYAAYQENPQAALVGQIVWSGYPQDPLCEHYKQTYFPAWTNYNPSQANYPLFITSNASVAKAGLVLGGGFDEAFRHNYEDIICGYRLEKQGYSVQLCEAALVYHNRPLPAQEMFRRNALAGREMTRLFRYYPILIGQSFLVNPAQVLDWGYHLTTIESLLANTLGNLDEGEIEEIKISLKAIADYLATQPFLHRIDQAYLDLLTTQQAYQRELHRTRWLEAHYQQVVRQQSSKVSLKTTLYNAIKKINSIPKKLRFGKPNKPTISLIVQRNRYPQDQAFTDSLQALNYQEIIFCNSPDDLSQSVKLAKNDLLVIVKSDSVLHPQLLETFAANYRPDTVMLGQELPLEAATGDYKLSKTPVSEVHFSSFRLNNVAIPRQLYDSLPSLFEPSLGVRWENLVVGWKLASKAKLRFCPQALVYTSQRLSLAESLETYIQPNEMFQRRYPELAALQALTQRAATLEDLHLLYDTLKEYPFAQGLLQGLQDHFELEIYEDLATQPLFSEQYKEWQAQRQTYLQSQRLQLEQGLVELKKYAQHIENILRNL